ncbi:hypothetical protein B938_05985 [Bacillus velezensis AS43.3]|nr:hypothetical protein B938_05985 [Bacillus velezensis AS43.3]
MKDTFVRQILQIVDKFLVVWIIIWIGGRNLSYFIILIVVAIIGALVTTAVGIISSKVETISLKTPRDPKEEEQKSFYTMK